MITISKELGEFRFRKNWIRGYPVRFRKEADRGVFEHTRLVLFKPSVVFNDRLGRKRWALADSSTGAFWYLASTRESLKQFLRKVTPHWPLYRLILACRLDHCNTVGPKKWGTTRVEPLYTDEFNALLVAAKMEGLTNKSTLKDLTDATRNTTTAAV